MAISANRSRMVLLERPFLHFAYPYLFFVLVFWLVPVLYTIWTSFHYSPIWGKGRFVWLDQYAVALTSDLFWIGLGNTLLLALLVIVLAIAFGLGLVFLFGKVGRLLARVLLVASLLPGFCSPFGLSFLFLLLFHGDQGLLNQWFVLPFGGTPIDWMRDPAYILLALVMQAVWRWTGFMALFLRSSYESISVDQFEAARLEGASDWRAFCRIGIPAMLPTMLYCSLFLLIDCFTQFAGAYVLLGASGGVGEAGLTLVGLSYRVAYVQGDFGAASAISVISFAAVALVLTLGIWVRFAIHRRALV